MKVTNKTSFKICAYCWHTKYGFGDPEVILPEKSEEIRGPLLIDQGDEKGYLAFPEGEIICHEHPDDDNGFQVTPSQPLTIEIKKEGEKEIKEEDRKGITVEFTTSDLVIF